MMDENVRTTLEAINLVRKAYNPFEVKYGSHASIYIAPTGNVKDMMAEFKKAKRVLAVGGAGAFGFEAGINDAEVVDMFDCNVLQKHFYELVKASITILPYEEFMDYFTLKTQGEMQPIVEWRNLLAPDLLFKVGDLLPFETSIVFTALYQRFSHYDMLNSALFRLAHAIYRDFLTRFASMYNEEAYYKLQEKLRKQAVQISYQTASLFDLPKKFDGPYDLVVLGNIPQYYKNISGLNSVFAMNTFIKKELSKLLAPDGVIAVNYGFECSTRCLKNSLGLQNLPSKSYDTPKGRFVLREEAKQDIMTGLYKKGGYEVFFIVGVETFDGQLAENSVLTYRPLKPKQNDK